VFTHDYEKHGMNNNLTKITLLAIAIFFTFGCTTHAQVPPLLINQLLYAKIPNFATYSSQIVELNYGQLTGTSDGGTQWSMKLDMDSSSYAIGDFNNDGLSDIAAIITANGGGSGDFAHLVLFSNNNGTPQYMMDQELGDRITINKIGYNGGIFSADIITQGPNDPMCCGTLHEIVQYKIQDGSLVQISGTNSANGTNTPAVVPSSPSSTGYEVNWTWIGYLFWAIILGIIIGVRRNQNKAKTSNKNSHTHSEQRHSNTNQSHTHTKERRPQNDPEMRDLYLKVIHKYHPDFARGDEDKKFRTELTAKLNRAYQEGDIATLKFFQ
jgi:preprotein translocase subunit SecG